jgi:RHS repeat-associated protein
VYDGYQAIEKRRIRGNVLLQSYVYGRSLNEPVMLIDSSEGTTRTYYFQRDDLNTVHALLDDSGTEIEKYDYSAYGETRILDANGQTLMVDDDADEEFDLDQDGIIDIGYPRAGEPVTPRVVATQSLFDNPFGYAGMRRDEHTGLYHTHYREYNPNMGRWLTPDPAGYQDGQNLYCYYPNVNGVDVLGLAAYDPWYVNWIEEPFIGATAFAGEAIGTVKNAIVKDYRKWSGLSDNIKASSALSNEELVEMSRQVPNSTQAAKEIVDVVRPHLEDVPKGINAIATGIVNRDAQTVLAGGALLGGVALDVVDFVPDPSDAAQMAARKTALETIEGAANKTQKLLTYDKGIVSHQGRKIISFITQKDELYYRVYSGNNTCGRFL